MKFENKEEYLKYRAEWKLNYKTISEIIRDKRFMYKEFNRAIAKANINIGNPSWLRYDERGKYNRYIDLILADNQKYTTLKKLYIRDYTLISDHIKQATAMLEELKIAKQEANKQYLLSKKIDNG